MFSEVRKRVKKAGQPPGTPVYTGKNGTQVTTIDVITYNKHDCRQVTGTELDKCLPEKPTSGTSTWVSVEGLSDIQVITELTKRFNLHPLTVEDILNIEQRPKVEEFDNYIFITLKILIPKANIPAFSVRQLSLVLGKDFVLSFQEMDTTLFDKIIKRLSSTPDQRLRQQGVDYLAYRLIDAVVDEYFVVLEGMGDQIEDLEEGIISSPNPQNARLIYRMKRNMLLLRKSNSRTEETKRQLFFI